MVFQPEPLQLASADGVKREHAALPGRELCVDLGANGFGFVWIVTDTLTHRLAIFAGIVEDAEGVTHYGFNLRAAGIRQIRDRVRVELKQFEQKLGLISTSEDARSRSRLLDSMKELNELASELGLLTQQNMGVHQTDADILLRRLVLPEENSLRVELGDRVGPVDYDLKSNSSTPLLGSFRVRAKQAGREDVNIYAQNCQLRPSETVRIAVPPFEIHQNRYEGGRPLRLEAVFVKEGTTKPIARCSRTIFVGIDPQVNEKPGVQVSLRAHFPRSGTPSRTTSSTRIMPRRSPSE